jgi:hypothetical protein
MCEEIGRARRCQLDQRRSSENWINPLLKRLDLVREGEANLSRNAYWRQIEACELVERVGRLVAEVNLTAGYRILEMVDFLPPQKNVLRVSFDRQAVKHSLEIMIRNDGIVLMFSTKRRFAAGWRHIVSTFSKSKRRNSTLVWEQTIHPGEILEQNIQAWVSFLLSGLDKKFRLDQILQASVTTNTDLNATLRKISA